jgi:hypothetical protein
MSARPHPLAQPKRPLGQPTRGKTARNRLRRVDTFLALYDPGLLLRTDGGFDGAWFVDLGYGVEPITTLESAQRLRRINPALPVLGVEIDPERVAAAQPYADKLTQFRLGGFNVPLQPRADGSWETARAIRAFNVLRQYEENEAAGAWTAMASSLLPGGLLIEGTSEPFGRVWVANVLRRVDGEEAGDGHGGETGGETPPWLRYEGLLFSTNWRLGFDPAQFQAVLPKNLIHHMTPGEPIDGLMGAWKRAARETMATRAWGPRQWFIASAHRLAGLGYPIVLRPKLLNSGYLLVRRI